MGSRLWYAQNRYTQHWVLTMAPSMLLLKAHLAFTVRLEVVASFPKTKVQGREGFDQGYKLKV